MSIVLRAKPADTSATRAARPGLILAVVVADRPTAPCCQQGVAENADHDQLHRTVDAGRKDPPDVVGDGAAVDQDMVHADPGQQLTAAGVAGGGQHGHAAQLGEYGQREPHRRGAAADEQALRSDSVTEGRWPGRVYSCPATTAAPSATSSASG